MGLAWADAARSPSEKAPDPALVEVTRGAMTESRHRVAFAVIDAAGSVLMAAGHTESPIYPRSAIKPLQALALVETGAAAAFGLGDTEIALACASHSGEAAHVAAVLRWLGRIGCDEADLECGAHGPVDQKAADDLVHAGAAPGPAHNNCSGKHAGFLSVARHLGHPTRGYVRLEHPVQQRVLGILEQMSGCELFDAPRGIDGCGVPVIGIPLGNVAFAMAQFADPRHQPGHRREAVARIRAAMAARPFFVGGSGRFDTRVIEATAGRVLVKTGAEGVYCGILADEGIGVALKAEDGAARAAQFAMANLLDRLGAFDRPGRKRLADLIDPVLFNHVGAEVGRIRLAGREADDRG